MAQQADTPFDQAFLALFNGKDSISGRALGYQQAKAWLDQGDKVRKMLTCLVFYEKPIQFLATGRTAGGKGDGNHVDVQLVRYLPQHDATTEGDLLDRLDTKFGAFKRVNFSMVRRVALLAVQKEWIQGNHTRQWVQAYGGRPSQVQYDSSKWMGMTTESFRIKREGIVAFVEDRTFWVDLNLAP